MTWRIEPIATKIRISNKAVHAEGFISSQKKNEREVVEVMKNTCGNTTIRFSHLSGENLEKLLVVGISPTRLL